MKRLFKWLGGLILVVVAVVALAAITLVVAPKPTLAWLLKNTADMEFTADKASLGLFPIALGLTNGTFSGMGNDATLVALQEGQLRFSWWDYLTDKPTFWSLDGRDVKVDLSALESDSANSQTLDTSTDPSVDSTDAAGSLDLRLPLGFRHVVVDNLAISSATGDTQTLSVNLQRPQNAADLVDLALTLQQAAGPFSVAGQLQHNRAGPIDINLHLPSLDLTALMSPEQATSDEASEPTEPTDLAALLATAAKVNLRIDELIAPPNRLTDVVLKSSMGDGVLDLAELSLNQAPTGSVTDQYMPLNLSARIEASASRVDITNLVATMGASDLNGNLSLIGDDPLGAPERIEGKLTSEQLQFVTLDAPIESAPTESAPEEEDANAEETVAANTPDVTETPVSESESESESEPAATEDVAEKLFSDEPLPLAFLQQLQADVTVNAKRLQLLDAQFEDLSIDLKNDATTLQLVPKASFGDGGFAGNLSVTPTDDVAVVDLGFTVTDVDLEAFGVVPTEELTGGKTNLDINLKGAGASSAALASSLNGEILLRVTEAVVQNDTFELAGSDLLMELLSKLNPFDKKDPTNKLSCALVRFEAVDDSDSFLLDKVETTEKMEIVGNGKIDLGKETLDIGITPNAKGGVGLNVGSLVKFLKLGGTLSSPSPQASAGGLLKSGAAIGAAASTGGLSIIAESLAKRVVNAGNACERALANKEKEDEAAASAAAEDTVEPAP